MKKEFDTTKYVGIPYKNKGRTYEGVDCWGLVRIVYKDEYDVHLLSFSSDYENATDGEAVKEVVRKGKALFEYTEKCIPEYGDIGVFNMMGNPCHVGIYIGKNKILHVLKGTNSVCENLSSIRLKNRLEGWYEVTR